MINIYKEPTFKIKMEVLPYISGYLLIYAFALNFLLWFMPAPYGKFSYQKNKWCGIDSWMFSCFTHAGFISIVAGWFEGDWKRHNINVKEGRGMLLFIILCVYIVVRCLSPLIYKVTMRRDRGTKKVNVLWLIPYLAFWIPAGFYWSRVVSKIDKPFELYDIILCALALLFWVLNVYSDFKKNYNRDEGKKYEVIGKYLNQKQIYKEFSSLERLYHVAALPPNYTFEIAFWFVFVFISWSWEGLWWFCCMFAFLFTRGVWQKTWYNEPIIKGTAEETSELTGDGEDIVIQGKMTF